MDISIKTVEQVTVVDLAGDVDANTAPTVQERFTASPAREQNSFGYAQGTLYVQCWLADAAVAIPAGVRKMDNSY